MKITKAHIICTLISENGPMTKAELLKETARIEGKPYRPASNGSYFQPHNDPNGHDRIVYNAGERSLVANGTIEVFGKRGNALLYTNTVKGLTKAAELARELQPVKGSNENFKKVFAKV